MVQWELGKEGRGVEVYIEARDILIHAVMDGALLLLQKGCIRYTWNIEELQPLPFKEAFIITPHYTPLN